MHSEYTIIFELIPRASKRVNDGHAVLRPDEDFACCVHTPRFAGLVDDPVSSDLDECTRETADTCIQK